MRDLFSKRSRPDVHEEEDVMSNEAHLAASPPSSPENSSSSAPSIDDPGSATPLPSKLKAEGLALIATEHTPSLLGNVSPNIPLTVLVFLFSYIV